MRSYAAHSSWSLTCRRTRAGSSTRVPSATHAGGIEYTVRAFDDTRSLAVCRAYVSVLQCASELICEANETSHEIQLSWNNPGGVEGWEVHRDGSLLAQLEAAASGYVDDEPRRSAEYSVTAVGGDAELCSAMTCQAALCSDELAFEAPVRFNMGGPRVVDSCGRTWLADSTTGASNDPSDPQCIRADPAGGTNSLVSWCPPTPDSVLALGFDPDHGADVALLNSIRWDTGIDGVPFELNIPLADGRYNVVLYFIECCCPGRHFSIHVEDEVLAADVSLASYSEFAELSSVGNLRFNDIAVDDGSLSIALIGCGEPDCPGATDINAIVSAIEVLPFADEAVTRFFRGDPNDDGSTNLTDPVTILNVLFRGVPAGSCLESADINDDGSINVTDPIVLLQFLFQGGSPPAPPGPPGKMCGVDPMDSPGDLGCDQYSSCG